MWEYICISLIANPSYIMNICVICAYYCRNIKNLFGPGFKHSL